MPTAKTILRHRATYKQRQKLTRRDIRTFMDPIFAGVRQLRTGEVDAVRGYAVQADWNGGHVRMDYCLNGYLALIERLDANQHKHNLETIAKRLEHGVLLSIQLIDDALTELKQHQDMLLSKTRDEVAGAARTEQIAIELQALGIT